MFLKTYFTNWVALVKTATTNYTEQLKMWGKMIEARNNICGIKDIDDRPVNANDPDIGKTYCQITYCITDWLGSVNEQAPGSSIHKCPYFNGRKCSQNCEAKAKNHAFFDAETAYNVARKKYKDSVKRIFGIKVK